MKSGVKGSRLALSLVGSMVDFFTIELGVLNCIAGAFLVLVHGVKSLCEVSKCLAGVVKILLSFDLVTRGGVCGQRNELDISGK